ncbi:methyl-accepting chemotaxis protein [Pararhizobium sp. YC-54]|uniref:methyl-accepting chemotaxis protein n=1 Tax=Pararhizobium sp. YC-54 TaxID=2986920 RepID=UPI0021F77F29|nr:HAMP domain-containing methyl-accepting chemotaxis protein [Pararhizobium sp. YC-54]MCW0000429.1 methyl-accepting chemotaxis protein [Pararhizobium sp. YC-54]
MHLKLSHKIGLLVPIAVAGILSIVAIFIVEKAMEQSFREKERAIEASDKALLVLESKMLAERGAEKDFLLQKSEEAVLHHEEFSVETGGQLEVLRQTVPDASVQQKLQAITAGLDVYLAEFKSLVTANRELGLDSSKGREGEMRAAVHSIETLLKEIKDNELRASMLTMRRHEKDFIMRRDAKYVASHAAEAKIFAAFAPARFGSKEAYDSIMEALQVYQSTFKAYAATAATESEARQSVSKAFSDVEPLLAALMQDLAGLRKTAEADNARAIARAENLAVAAVITAILLLSLTVYLVGRGISRPIVATTRAMTGLAGGDTTSSIPFTGRKDEIGEMAGAVEIFRQAAIANHRLEAEAQDARARSEADRIRLTQEAEAAAQARLQQATSGLASGLRRLAAGDLSFQLNDAFAPDFEALRHDLNAAVKQLGNTLSAVTQSAGSIDDGTREISQSSDDLSRRTEQQAASLEETAAALDQITVNVSNSSKRADEARTVAVQANASAAQSGAVVANAVEAMRRIEESSSQISNIIGVIDEIAFQTNLLALNAGVEAARAGDAGKGFAVVAQEVRELAQRSAKAAKEIKELIRNSSVEVEGGVKLVRDTGDALKTIETYVVTINQHMDAIATSAREQSVGLAEVNTAVNQMDQVTQQNAAMVEETNAASATLANEASRLRELIAQFQLDAGRGSPGTAAYGSRRAA